MDPTKKRGAAWPGARSSTQKKSEVTQLLWLETPANPMWDVVDLREACKLAHGVGAIVCADSTVFQPGF